MSAAGPVAFLFDIGNVLVSWNPDFLLRKILPDQAAIACFREEAMTWERIYRMDRGQTWAEQLAEIQEHAPQHHETAKLYHARWIETVGGAIEPIVTLRDQLRSAGFPVFALSNYGVENFERALVDYPFLDDFDGKIISGYENLVKPEPEIFELAISRFGLTPSTTLFIDDVTENIETARRLGFLTHHFLNPEGLLREAAAWLEPDASQR